MNWRGDFYIKHELCEIRRENQMFLILYNDEQLGTQVYNYRRHDDMGRYGIYRCMYII